MIQSQVPNAPNLDILTEIVTDTRTAPSTATAQMLAILGELDKDAAQSGLIIGSAGRSSLAERLRKTLVEFKRGLWSQPPDQLGGVISTIDNYLTYFSGDDVAEVFCADNTSTVLRGLQKYTPVVCHANGRFRKTLIPPRTTRAGLLSGGCNETRRHFYKPQGRLGLIQMTNLQLCRHRPTLTAGLQIDTAMLFGTANYLRVWRYDIRRTKKIQTFQPDVFGSVSVGMFCVPAHLANKEIPGPSICPFSVQTLIAPLAGVLRIHKDHGHPGSLCFVGDETTKLSERPTVQSVELIFFSPYPFANAVEFFEGDPAFGALSQRYNAFGNYMIGMSGKSSLFSAPLPQETFGALGSLFLKLLAKSLIAMANLINLLPTVAVSVRIKGNTSHSQIYTNEIHYRFLFYVWNVDCDMEKELAIPVDQVALSARVREQFNLFFSADKWDGESLWQCPDRDKRLVQVPGEKTQVVDDCTGGLEGPLRLTDGVSVGDLGAYQTSGLSGQPEEQPDAFIVGALEFKMGENTKLYGTLRQPVTCRVNGPHGIKQTFALCSVRQKFHLNDGLQSIQ